MTRSNSNGKSQRETSGAAEKKPRARRRTANQRSRTKRSTETASAGSADGSPDRDEAASPAESGSKKRSSKKRGGKKRSSKKRSSKKRSSKKRSSKKRSSTRGSETSSAEAQRSSETRHRNQQPDTDSERSGPDDTQGDAASADAEAPPARAQQPADGDGLPAPTGAGLDEQIRALEARLDGMIKKAAGSRSRSVAEVADRAAPETNPFEVPVAAAGEAEVDRETRRADPFAAQYSVRRWGRMTLRDYSEEVDDFGLNRGYEKRTRPFFDALYRKYFRVEVDGVEQVPGTGRCLLVANHSGALPLDGIMLRTAFRLDHPESPSMRWLAEDYVFYLPFLGAFVNRIGAVRACQENAERLLGGERLVAVFPEGVKGAGKLFRERYKLQRFGRGGFIRLALRTGAPLVPCAIVGAEETNPLISRGELLAKLVGLPYLPITPTFPLLGPFGLIPAPAKWRIRFGEPLDLSEYGPEGADDHLLVTTLAERVRTGIQRMVDDLVAQRTSVLRG